MAVTWDADWRKRPGGPILILIQGYLDEDHQTPVWGTGEIIRRRTLLDRLLKRNPD